MKSSIHPSIQTSLRWRATPGELEELRRFKAFKATRATVTDSKDKLLKYSQFTARSPAFHNLLPESNFPQNRWQIVLLNWRNGGSCNNAAVRSNNNSDGKRRITTGEMWRPKCGRKWKILHPQERVQLHKVSDGTATFCPDWGQNGELGGKDSCGSGTRLVTRSWRWDFFFLSFFWNVSPVPCLKFKS